MNYEVFIPPANNEKGEIIINQHKEIDGIESLLIQGSIQKLVRLNTFFKEIRIQKFVKFLFLLGKLQRQCFRKNFNESVNS